jgi:hypothetical protein
VIVDGKVINLEVPLTPSRSGTLPDKKSSEVLGEPSIEEPIAAFWSMI